VCFETGYEEARIRKTDRYGLSLPPISLLYKKQQVSQACQLMASTDPIVRFTTTVEIKREEALKRATH